MAICSQEAAFALERESHAATGRRCREIAIALARSAPPMFERRPACALLSKSAYALAAAEGNLPPRRTICSRSLALGVRLSRKTALRSAWSAVTSGEVAMTVPHPVSKCHVLELENTGSEFRMRAGYRKSGDNTPFDRRYEWAARYLARVPLKDIAAQDEAASSAVGRVARGILRIARQEETRVTHTRRSEVCKRPLFCAGYGSLHLLLLASCTLQR